MKKFKGVTLGMVVLMAGYILLSMPHQVNAAEKKMGQSVASKGDEIGFGTILFSDIQSNSISMTVAKASNNYPDGNASVTGDGVRLRKSPSKSATILELMYKGESVLINYTKSGKGKGVWYYVKRMKTGTWGWVSTKYIWEWD